MKYRRTLKVKGLDRKSPSEYKFDCDGKEITIAQYFKNKYGHTLQYPKLPCLDVGTKDKPNLVPIEVTVP